MLIPAIIKELSRPLFFPLFFLSLLGASVNVRKPPDAESGTQHLHIYVSGLAQARSEQRDASCWRGSKDGKEL